MSSILNRELNRATSKAVTSNSGSVFSEQIREKLLAIAPKASVVFVIAGFGALLRLSVINDKLFFNELFLSSFIILALIFFKASAAPRK